MTHHPNQQGNTTTGHRLRPAPLPGAGPEDPGTLNHGKGRGLMFQVAPWKAPVDAAPTGKRVLMAGAGPHGLSAAYHRTRLGRSVTTKDVGRRARWRSALHR
jgi:hypothetical protein